MPPQQHGIPVIALVTYVAMALLIGQLSRQKGGSFIAGFGMAVLITPILAGVILLLRRGRRRLPERRG